MQLNLLNSEVFFLLENKKSLLSCAESAAKFINERGSGIFLDLLLDLLEISERVYDDEDMKKQYFCEIIYDNKSFNVEKVLSGGKSLSYTFKGFIEEFLQISKDQEGYAIKNKEFEDLTVDQLKYVLGWARRLTVKGSGGKSKTN